jgi:hypothetical protein
MGFGRINTIYRNGWLNLDNRLWKWLVETLDTRLWKWLDRDINHLWKRQ